MTEPSDGRGKARQDDMGGEGGAEDERHPLTKAAWDGYRQYREEMDQRGFMGSMHNLSFKDMLLLGVIMAGILGLLVFLQPEA